MDTLGKQIVRTPTFARILSELESGLESGSSNRLVLVGQPGVGKSVLLKELQRNLSAHQIRTILVRLRDVSSEEELASIVTKQLMALNVPWHERESTSHLLRGDLALRSDLNIAPSVLKTIIRDFSEHGRLVLLADGLDESREPEQLASTILELADLPSVSVVVTSRNAYFLARLSRFREFRIIQLDRLLEAETAGLVAKEHADIPVDVQQRLIKMAAGNPLLVDIFLKGYSTLGRIDSVTTDSVQLIDAYIKDIIFNTSDPQSTQRALTIVAILQPVSVDFLKELGVDVIRLAYVLSYSGIGYTRESDKLETTYVELAHKIFEEYFVSKYALSGGLLLADLDFGAEAAERDTLLDDHYQKQPNLGRILDAETTIVIGDRGSGKSASFRFLADNSRSDRKELSERSVFVAAVKDHSEFLQKRNVSMTLRH